MSDGWGGDGRRWGPIAVQLVKIYNRFRISFEVPGWSRIYLGSFVYKIFRYEYFSGHQLAKCSNILKVDYWKMYCPPLHPIKAGEFCLQIFRHELFSGDHLANCNKPLKVDYWITKGYGFDFSLLPHMLSFLPLLNWILRVFFPPGFRVGKKILSTKLNLKP